MSRFWAREAGGKTRDQGRWIKTGGSEGEDQTGDAIPEADLALPRVLSGPDHGFRDRDGREWLRVQLPDVESSGAGESRLHRLALGFRIARDRFPVGRCLVTMVAFSFLYTVLPLAFWGHTPGMAWAGIALLVAAGLYVLHGERSRARAELEAIQD